MMNKKSCWMIGLVVGMLIVGYACSPSPAPKEPAAEQPAEPQVEEATQSAMGEIQVNDLLAMASNRDGKAFF